MPYPITQSWEFHIPIPHWILHFFYIERGLVITFTVTISAHWENEEFNLFIIKAKFRRQSERFTPPRLIEESEIVFGYLWPNLYYHIDENLIVRTPSEGSTNSGSGSITLVNPETPELHKVQLPPPPIPKILEIPGIVKFNHRTAALRQRVEDHNCRIRELPLTSEARLNTILERVRVGINLDELAFSEGSLTYQNLCWIDQLTNPQYYLEVSLLEDADYQPPRVEDPEPLGEEEEVEEEEQCLLHIPDLSGIHLRIPPSEHNSEDLLLERLRDSLDTHLGTIIDETFQYPKSE